MSLCKWCNVEVPSNKNLGAHVTNCHSNPNHADIQLKIKLKRTKQRFQKELVCLNCDKQFFVIGTQNQVEKASKLRKYCSKICSCTYSSSCVKNRGGSKERKCEICGENSKLKAGGTGRFCHLHKKRLIKNSDLEFHQLKNSNVMRRRLIEERSHSCEQCHLSIWLGEPIPLQMDHINGNPEDNEKLNLRLLCPNCHCMTPTWGSKNRGKYPNAERNIRRKLRRAS